MTAWQLCPACGALTAGPCPRHTPPATTATDAGEWLQLARTALQQRSTCEACGRASHLQATLTPRAWARRGAGLPVRLVDALVLCDTCAHRAGSARPGARRFAVWLDADGDLDADRPDPTCNTSMKGNRP